MGNAFHRCLQEVLQVQHVLGEKEFPLKKSVLCSFLQNKQLIFLEKAENFAEKTSLEGATEGMREPSQEILPPLARQDGEKKYRESGEKAQGVSFTLPDGSKEEQWNWLKQKVLSCPQCLRHVYPGKKLVFGSGNLQADLFFCGEAPGAEEEEQGEVFVGRAGQLLTKMIEAMGLHRSDVYIGNIMNWRPETPNHIGNRPPTQEEMQFCLPYLIGQVEIVAPKVIVALGATAVNGLLGYDPQRRMRDCRGRWFEFHKIPLLITYHPSYLLRNATAAAKRMVWEDLLRVMQFLNLPISERQKSYFL